MNNITVIKPGGGAFNGQDDFLPPPKPLDLSRDIKPTPPLFDKKPITCATETTNVNSIIKNFAIEPHAGVEHEDVLSPSRVQNLIRQIRLEKKASALAKRIRLSQTKCTQDFTFFQLKNFVNFQQTEFDKRIKNAQTSNSNSSTVASNLPVEKYGSAKKVFQNLLVNNNWHEKLETLFKNGCIKAENFKCDEMKQLSPGSLAKLLKKYNSSNKKLTDLLAKFCQSAPPAKFSRISIGPSTSVTVNVNSTCVANTLPLADVMQAGDVSATLFARLNDLKSNYDPEATDSSSGGESCDKLELSVENSSVIPNKKTRLTPLERRSSYRWRLERASLGSQVSFIKAQVMDLEHKIRHHTEIYKQLRQRKLTDRYPKSINLGLVESEHSARTSPPEVKVSARIVRTAGMFRWNRKTARLSTVHCCCCPPWPPCAMCSGRVNNTLTVPDICAQTRRERASLLDHSYHPSLSDLGGKDVSLATKLQGFWKQETVAVRSMAKDVVLSHLKDCKSITSHSKNSAHSESLSEPSKHKKYHTSGSKYSEHRRLDRNGAMSSALAAKKLSKKAKKGLSGVGKYGYEKSSHGASKRELKTLKPMRGASSSLFATEDADRQQSSSGSSTPASLGSSKFDASSLASPIPGKLGFGLHGRRSTFSHSTYDIDNIVIDPRVAAMTRVEKLPYKEIVTPGWRLKEYEPVTVGLSNGMSNEPEDLTEETYAFRHSEKEKEEHKRFSSGKSLIFSGSSRKSISTVSPAEYNNATCGVCLSPSATDLDEMR